jgi:hypothetical protein
MALLIPATSFPCNPASQHLQDKVIGLTGVDAWPILSIFDRNPRSVTVVDMLSPTSSSNSVQRAPWATHRLTQHFLATNNVMTVQQMKADR